ncbi:cupin domain-containing protein [Nocardia sp. NBC_00511]|uniref:cupin domain-containing protein n=1 Tax=Nocardia sp. NBC_00511 TaxID=2903591 RepID=UPI0030E51FB5
MTATADMFDTLIQLRAGGSVDITGRGNPGADPGLWTVAAFRAEDDRAVHSDVWERHPAGEEVLCLLRGRLAVFLRDEGDGVRPHATLTPGDCFVVPPGQWHRLSVLEPCELMSITPRPGTTHEKA